MKINPETDEVTFTSNNTARPNMLIVGIGLVDNDCYRDFDSVCFGSDDSSTVIDGKPKPFFRELSHADAVELADAMLERWAAFRAYHLAKVK